MLMQIRNFTTIPFYHLSSGWNELSRDLQDSPTVASFKARLNSNIAIPPPYYFTGIRQDQIHHTRLRLH